MGFGAFILLSSAIASMGGILGITLPFVYTGAPTVLGFFRTCWISLIFMGISGQSIWRGNERIQRERMLLSIVVLHAILIHNGENMKKIINNYLSNLVQFINFHYFLIK